MQRIPEPELMLDPAQAKAYAQADFAVPHQQIADQFVETFPDLRLTGDVLDLGCGPADLLIRFAKAWPNAHFHGIDGSAAMLTEGRNAIAQAGLNDRITLYQLSLPTRTLPKPSYQAVISNSLLHHLHAPQVLWQTIKQVAAPHSAIYITDLRRPETAEQAQALVNTYSNNESDILQQDFHNSLLAAFSAEEVRQQLKIANLSCLHVTQIGDRHLQISGLLADLYNEFQDQQPLA